MLKIFFKIILIIVIVSMILLLPQLFSETTAITSYISSILTNNNFHTVVEDRLYRSGDMSNKELSKLLKDKKINTVVDLHYGDDEPDRDGLIAENIVTESGANYFHVPLLGSRIPSIETVRSLVKVFDQASFPVLVHCSSGTHRSGVASIIWLLTQENVDPKIAVQQLSTKYGYFYFERWLKGKIQGHATIDQLIWNYIEDYNQNGISFRDWIKDENSFNGQNGYKYSK